MADPVPVPEGTAPPAIPPVAAPPQPPATPPTQDENSPWLKPRLESARATGAREREAALLAELGTTDLAAAKAAIAAAKAAEDAGKSAEQRAAELASKLATTSTQAERNAAIINEHAARMLGVLSPKQQELVKSFAGEDPALQLSTIQKLTDNGVLNLEDETATPPPANTAPPPTAPTGAPGSSPPDHKAAYSSLRNTNPFAAAAYGLRHASEVYKPNG